VGGRGAAGKKSAGRASLFRNVFQAKGEMAGPAASVATGTGTRTVAFAAGDSFHQTGSYTRDSDGVLPRGDFVNLGKVRNSSNPHPNTTHH